ncbi:FmdB family zinc ribbon protein [Nitrolancea hollandica]|uniref:Putative regulatory protein FmdB zinc ribbon domain-containing protein n=1 Tax=Nitrolancea hollandica Lb TaxID=1129897 RepID=I4EL49_9BACT|nr:zinc ribbon domain-containing protein [Nitrolancea hollandica]CCF85411.1 hypothetical protein NITHO_4930003 [Nitrolancea hollandica Lb]
MPLYTFRCDDCNETFDVFRPMREAGDPVTHRCGRTARRRFDSSSGVIIRPVGYNLPPEHPNYWKTLAQAEKEVEERPRWQI